MNEPNITRGKWFIHRAQPLLFSSDLYFLNRGSWKCHGYDLCLFSLNVRVQTPRADPPGWNQEVNAVWRLSADRLVRTTGDFISCCLLWSNCSSLLSGVWWLFSLFVLWIPSCAHFSPSFFSCLTHLLETVIVFLWELLCFYSIVLEDEWICLNSSWMPGHASLRTTCAAFKCSL